MKKLTAKQAAERFPQGTIIKFSAHFLRSIGDYSHASANRKATITGPIKSYSDTFHVVPIRWSDETEDSAVNCSNIIPADKIHLEPA